MAKQVFKMFMVVGTGRYNHGEVSIQQFEPSLKPDDSFGCRILRQFEIKEDVPEFDLRQMEIDALEKCVESERADSQVRINLLLERISKLQAIGHEVAE